MHTNDAGVEIAQTRSLLNEIKFMIGPFSAITLQHLIKLQSKEAEIVRNEIEEKQGETNIRFAGKCAIKVHYTIANSAIQEIVQKVDAMESEKECMYKKIGCNSEYVDAEIRNTLADNLITLSVMKCPNRYYQCSLRSITIGRQ